MNTHIKIVSICFFSFFLSSCERDVNIELPDAEQKLVIEGRIEADGKDGIPPIVILTKSVGFFEPTDYNTVQNLFVHNAKVTVSVDGITHTLEELCLTNLDPFLAPLASAFLGVSEKFNYCVYTVPLSQLLSGNYLKGMVGKTYYLTIENEGKTYTSSTTIPPLIPLDSVWYKKQKDDTLGFAWGRLTDPPGLGNAYRWYAKRLNVAKADFNYLAPFGSAFNDKFIEGVSFDFAYDRGRSPSGGEETPGEVSHYYKVGDTIAVKFCTIDVSVYEFLRLFEVEVNNNGSPFASPSSVPSNIEGGALGFWAGYGVTYDTIIALPE